MCSKLTCALCIFPSAKNCIRGSKRGARDDPPLPLGPISFIFIQFSVKILSNNRFLFHIHGLVPLPPSWKSWIHHWITSQHFNIIYKKNESDTHGKGRPDVALLASFWVARLWSMCCHVPFPEHQRNSQKKTAVYKPHYIVATTALPIQLFLATTSFPAVQRWSRCLTSNQVFLS